MKPEQRRAQSLSGWSREDRSRVSTVFCDIDDTLTRGNRLEVSAYSAIWALANAGYRVVPVTGRPAGWCDCIIRQWPIDAIVGENGAFTYYLVDGVRKELYHPEAGEPGAHADRLREIASNVYRTIPGTREAKDQPFRRFDVAVDFREEPPFLDFDAAEAIYRRFTEEGAVAKISSIHVNAWIGDYDKRSMTEITARALWNLDFAREADRLAAAFCGDSPNDEPMFAFFPNSVAVANVRETLDYISTPPGYITASSYGAGFAEFAEALLESRETSSYVDSICPEG